MNICEICGCNDERVLIKHHIDKNKYNNNPENIMVVCANCHIKIHNRKFKDKNAEINLKSQIFNDNRFYEEIYKLMERDRKVDKWLKQKFKIN